MELICQQALAWHAGNFNIARRFPIEWKTDNIAIAQGPMIWAVALWMLWRQLNLTRYGSGDPATRRHVV